MEKKNKYSVYLEDVNELYNDVNMELFVYVDLLLLSIFLGCFLFLQIHHWRTPAIVSVSFYVLFIIIFKLFFKDQQNK